MAHKGDNGGDDRRDYERGYCRPPREHQFKKGVSGNPKGKPKGAKGMKTILAEETSVRMEVMVQGKPEKGTRKQLAIRALAMRAALGELKAIKLLMDLCADILGVEDPNEGGKRLSRQDQDLLDSILADHAPADPMTFADRVND